ncbi:hypothetical protein [Lysobacter gummosus]
MIAVAAEQAVSPIRRCKGRESIAPLWPSHTLAFAASACQLSRLSL